ncbi:GxGYxYP domain-containing protein [Sedimentisphaera salicampi]|uniref:GxGYxY sequence motif-containing protein n=1 Tax=Sedimentisphaera salicampi TaxID=1941349 RepID=A0A1W6LMR1_9BACT|nr:GxGYxYP domain-containing protein [Sedimentisphaera salicampi]ARN57065.1 hypothetical protein STSP1_01460 [Sedimentisphaera salicampi]
MKITLKSLAILFACSCCFGMSNKITHDFKQKPELQILPKGSPLAENVDLVDLRNCSPETKLAAITLQGKVNSGEKSRVFMLVYKDKEADERAHTKMDFWLDYFKQKNHIKNYKQIDLDTYFAKYKDAYSKVIVCDPNLEASINVATMMCSLDDAIVISKSDLDKFSDGKEVIHLSGRWKKNVDAYKWAYENLWDKMNHKMLSCQHPTYAEHHLRDYLIRHKIFQFWVTGANVQDNPEADSEAELKFARKLMSKMPPCAPLVGWLDGGEDDIGLTEYGGVGIAGEYGMITLGTNWGANYSALSGISVDFASMIKRYQAKKDYSVPKLEDDKVYLSFVIQDSGDAPAYWQAIQAEVWKDENRGKLPIGWGITVSSLEMSAPMVEWFYDNAKANDYFYFCISGAGYCHPYRDFCSKTKNPEQAWDRYFTIIDEYAEFTGIEELGLYTDAWLEFDRKENDPVTKKFVNSLENIDTFILGLGRDKNIVKQGHNYLLGQEDSLVSHVVTRWDTKNTYPNKENQQWLANEIRKHTPKKRPAFIMVHPLSWSYFPTDLLKVTEMLGNEYQAISPRIFRDLYLKSIDK